MILFYKIALFCASQTSKLRIYFAKTKYQSISCIMRVPQVVRNL